MNNTVFTICFFLFAIFSSCKQKEVESEPPPPALKKLSEVDVIENKLKNVYPEFIARIENNRLVWTDSTTMIFDDGIKEKSVDSLINYPDIEDLFYVKYPMDSNYRTKLIPGYDPGRIRNEEFLKKMYGNTKEEVKKNLVEIIWLPNSDSTRILVTKINDVHKNLQCISNELDSLPDEFKKYVVKPAGTFNWRTISGTNRLSAHSFGIAIDINVKYSNYWKWQVNSKNELKYQNKIPIKIVKIFEKHGFIWGGKWYHYDTMHFEYRPELID